MSERLVVLGTCAFVGLAFASCGDSSASSPASGGGVRDVSSTDASGPRDAGASNDDDAGGSSATADASTSATCAIRAGARGLSSRKVSVAGLERTYLVYLPPSLDPKKPAPFVLLFHGYTMSGQEMHDITQYAALADSEGIAVAFPDGEGGAGSSDSPWNVEAAGQTVCGAGQYASAAGDDFAFIDAMKTDIQKDQCLDPAHQFATGFSMGGYFTEHVGCYRDDFRALAPHSGGTIADLSACTTGHVPILILHGTADSVIDDACDDPTAKPDPGFSAAASLWAKKNGCKNTFATVANTGTGGGTGQCYVYDGCPPDGQVELCTFNGMDHCWAGGATAGANGNSCPTFANATALQWSFFKTYAW